MTGSARPCVLVTGAAGFIGTEVVRQLRARGWRVRALVRRTSNLPFPISADLEAVVGDMRDAASLMRAAQGATVVVHMAAAKSDEKESADVNIVGATRLVEACRAAGCERIINISTQSVKIAQQGAYARTKNEADRVFHASGLKVTSLRPSIVYGEVWSGVFGTIIKFLQKLPVVPILGDGKWISAPVYVGDVAGAIIACIEHDATIGKTYDLGGPDQVSFDELIDRISEALGQPRRKVHVPFGLSLFGAKILMALLPKSPVTVSNVLGSNQNTDIDISPARADFGFSPMDLDVGIERVVKHPLANVVVTPETTVVLETEARTISRYLLDVEPSRELVSRYVDGYRQLLASEPVTKEVAAFHRHPGWLGMLDTAVGFFKPDSLLRKKVLLMAAILEATPEYAEFYLRPTGSLGGQLAIIIGQGCRGAVKLVAGTILYAWVSVRR